MASTLDITPVVKDSLENKQGVLEFTLQNTNVSIVNGLRRTLLTNINASVIDSNQSTFYKNTGRLHNEILIAYRLSSRTKKKPINIYTRKNLEVHKLIK